MLGDRWGVGPADVTASYACDSYVTNPTLTAWRGVTVDAPIATVWAWLIQVRLAPYSYDWLDNLGHRSPRELIGLEDPHVGDRFSSTGGRPLGRVVAVEHRAHLTAQIQEVDSAVQRGQVLKQNPPGGTTVKAGSTVTLTVSRGNQAQMPNLHGLTETQALVTLQRLGWTGTLHEVFTEVNDPTQVGLIVAQDVPAGTGFTRDQTITVTVGRDNTPTSTTTTSSPIFETPGFGGN